MMPRFHFPFLKPNFGVSSTSSKAIQLSSKRMWFHFSFLFKKSVVWFLDDGFDSSISMFMIDIRPLLGWNPCHF